jgi:hypothetical protein
MCTDQGVPYNGDDVLKLHYAAPTIDLAFLHESVLTIYGDNFGADGAIVSFSGFPCDVLFHNHTFIACTTNQINGNVMVTQTNKNSNLVTI